MTSCTDCGTTGRIGYFYPDGDPLCRSCLRAAEGPPVARRLPRGRDPVRDEASAHAAGRHRQRVIRNGVVDR